MLLLLALVEMMPQSARKTVLVVDYLNPPLEVAPTRPSPSLEGKPWPWLEIVEEEVVSLSGK